MEGTDTAGKTSKPYRVGALDGGELPEVGALFSETLAEFTDNIGPYALAGLGQLMVVIPVTVVALIGFYVVFFGGMFGTWMVGAVFASVLSQISEDLGGIAMLIASLASMLVPVLLMLPFLLILIAALVPIQASMIRAVAAHQRGERPLDLMASFSTATQGLSSVLLAGVIMATLTILGLVLCYLPALVVPIFFGFTTSFAALHRVGGLQAAQMSLKHALGHLNWYLMFGLMSILINMVSVYIPVLGPMFSVALHVRAYRALFGDGETPVVR